MTAFIDSLYNICNNEDVIQWNVEGTVFSIENIDHFSKIILPKYFKHKNYASFVRQLNMYNFTRKTDSNMENSFKEYFKNKYFQRNKLELISNIQRKTNSKKRKYKEVFEYEDEIKNLKDLINQNSKEISNLNEENKRLKYESTIEQKKILDYLNKLDETIKKHNSCLEYTSNYLIRNENINIERQHIIDSFGKELDILIKDRGYRLTEIEKTYFLQNNISLNEDSLFKRNYDLLGSFADSY